jgi:hypothetical protein
MPYYRIGGTMVHIRMDKRQLKKAPPACPFFCWERPQPTDGSIVCGERIRVRCMAMAPYLCDWPGCDVPICEDHALHLGPDLDVCPTHNHQRGLLSRLLAAPEGVNCR